MNAGIISKKIIETPFAVIDTETTGLTPGIDRIVEISVVRMDPGQKPKLMLDTLINPMRPIAATEIHGLYDEDVADAPQFGDIMPTLMNALSGCVLASYNIYFDLRFLRHECTKLQVSMCPPYICLMYMIPLLQLIEPDERYSLREACSMFGITCDVTHTSCSDAMNAALLLQQYFALMQENHIHTFADLACTDCDYEFLQSFGNETIEYSGLSGPIRPLKTRKMQKHSSAIPVSVTKSINGNNSYWELLKIVLADLKITDNESKLLREKQAELRLTDAQIRGMHAKAFMSVIADCLRDKEINEKECRTLNKLYNCLAAAGWAPGQAIAQV